MMGDEDSGMMQSMQTLMMMQMGGQIGMQVVQMLGMNMEGIGYFIDQGLEAVSKIGFGVVDFFESLQPYRPFPKGHPRHGEAPPTPEQELSRKRNVKLVQIMGFLVVSFFGWRTYSQWRNRNKPTSQALVA